MLQDNLREKDIIDKSVRDLQYVREHIKITKKSTEDELKNIKNKIRKNYRNEYLGIKEVELIKNA